jgi:hypothetical protein
MRQPAKLENAGESPSPVLQKLNIMMHDYIIATYLFILLVLGIWITFKIWKYDI